jgi:zinc protease
MRTCINRNVSLWLFATLTIVSANCFAQLNLADSIPVSPEIHKGKLANGLTWYVKQNARPEQKVELRLVIKAGSILEDDGQEGLAHFTEHMAFNGSKHFKKNELVSFLQSIGVEFGADLNASTGFDETIYILPIPTDKPENLEKGFLALEDWASAVTFDGKEIDKERGVVLEESRIGKGANDRMNKVILPKLFEGSRYAVRLPIGKEEVLKNFKHEKIKKFYKDWYRPDLMAVIAVGDIDPAEGKRLIEAHFGKLKNPDPSRPRSPSTMSSRKNAEGVVVTDPEATNHILQVYYSYKPEKKIVTIGDYRISVVQGLFNSMLNFRMQELTQKADPPFMFGASSEAGFVPGYTVYSSVAVVGKAGVKPALGTLMEENQRARQFGFTASELDRVRKSYIRGLERAYNERDKSESGPYADEYIRNFTEAEPIPGIANEFKYFKEFSETITLEEINQYAAKTIPHGEPMLVILNGPDKADFTIPTGTELLAIAQAAEQQQVHGYTEKIVAASLMEKAPVSGTITSEKKHDNPEFTELMLSNNVRVFLKITDFKNDQVLMNASRFGGQSLYNIEDQFNSNYASSLVQLMGVKDLSPLDLQRVLAGKSVNVSPRLNQYAEGISGQCGAADIESMLQLTHLYMTHPRKDDDLFKSFVSKQEAYLKNLMANPESVYQDSLQKILFNNHPRGPRYPRSDDFAKINPDRAIGIYKERLGNANGMTFAFVGNFEMEAMKKLVATYIGSLPSGPIASGYQDMGIRPVKGVVKREIKKGTEAKSHISIVFTGEAPWTADAALRMQALLDVLNIKLIESLREDLSGVYGAGAGGQLSKNPYNNYSIRISMPCGPENVDKLIQASLAEIQKIKDKGPLESDLNKVKETWIKQYRDDLKENNYWLAKLLQTAELGSNPADILTGETRINAITAKELQEAAKKYFNLNNYVQVVLFPEK